jgi:hypothetical protein
MRWIAIWLLMCGVACGQVEFDGVSSSAVYAGVTVRDGVFTISAWVEPDAGATGVIYDDGSWGHGYSFNIINNNLRYAERVATVWTFMYASNVVVDGESALFAVTRTGNAGTVSFYKDGVFVAQYPATGIISFDGGVGSVGAAWYAGTLAWQSLFEGTITDARLFSRALSAGEINEIYNRPWALADDPDLVLRTCIVTNQTGTALTGVAPNYGTGVDGTYSNSPTAAPWTIQHEKPRHATIKVN